MAENHRTKTLSLQRDGSEFFQVPIPEDADLEVIEVKVDEDDENSATFFVLNIASPVDEDEEAPAEEEAKPKASARKSTASK